ncbi:MAG: potassium channel family protein [Thermoanaerobaculia bacterium]
MILIYIVLWDGFETILMARRVARRLRITRAFYTLTWTPWARLSGFVPGGNRRESFLSIYGPLSFVLLLGIWAGTLITGFALLYWGAGTVMHVPPETEGFSAHLYFSGSTFFTLGLGDVRPITTFGRVLTVIEAGTGFGFLALVIGFLPGLSEAFSRREVNIALLDARAGSPPTALELLRRHGNVAGCRDLSDFLHDWERWSSELLESHISFPVLAFFRSQHDNQSWLGALTTVLDSAALVVVGIDGAPTRPAWLTFAMARHAMVDMCSVLHVAPREPSRERLSAEDLSRLRQELESAGIPLRDGDEADAKLRELRAMYEPYAIALELHLRMRLPEWLPREPVKENWQGGA